ncbi:GntR family transcriptional regulator [Aneurinibacillus sp. REN35]|uniref:GntR family transcriptional regulator n=1 Tax=Aneurinibacillus sp. REN35 TaxID=3237286 RepID=UPI003528FD4F
MSKRAKESLEDYVYESIKSAILTRKIPLKMHLSEEHLAEAFSVSRTPIRTVLKRLHYEKMIQLLPNKGAFINQPSTKEIEDVFQLRTLLETEAVKIACRNATEEQLDELESLTYAEEELYKQDKYDKAIQITSDFHQAIVMVSGNEIMGNYSRELINITNVYLAYHEHADKESPLCPNEHRMIIQAIRKRDEAEAVRVFLEHFTTVKKHLNFKKENEEITLSDIFKPYSKSKQ